jgi:uracil-DNA glycosylase family 4
MLQPLRSKTSLEVFRSHVQKWRSCDKCELSRDRQKVVFARGEIPAVVLFVGEAPGESEDVVGMPFVGLAGHLLDLIINRSVKMSWAVYNLVGCFPRGQKQTSGCQPPFEAIEACAPRLEEFIAICQPKLTVAMGPLVKRCMKYDVAIMHPAAMLRLDETGRRFEVQQAVVKISTALLRLEQGSWIN